MIRILRDRKKNYTPGILLVDNAFICYSLEPPWKDNQKNISSIPAGEYDYITSMYTSKKGESYPAIKILGVPGRTGIYIHAGNFVTDTTGCIIVGKEQPKGFPQVNNSRSALEELLAFSGASGKIRFEWIDKNLKARVEKSIHEQIMVKELEKEAEIKFPKISPFDLFVMKFHNVKIVVGTVSGVGAGVALKLGQYTWAAILGGVSVLLTPGGLIAAALKGQTKYGEKGEFTKANWLQMVIDFLKAVLDVLKKLK